VSAQRRAPTRRRAVGDALVLVAVGLFAFAAATLFRDYEYGWDYRALWDAGNAVLAGTSPYGLLDEAAIASAQAYVYPPSAAVALSPLTLLSLSTATHVFTGLLAVSFAGAIWIVGVRDWRCYALAGLSYPVLSAILLGTLTPLLALAIAIAWRYRERAPVVGVALGLAIAIKLFLWPALLWLLVMHRARAASWAAGSAAVALLVSWAAVSFHGLAGYSDRLTLLADVWAETSYSPVALVAALGAPQALALVLPLTAVGAAGLAAARHRLSDEAAFLTGLAAALLLTPIVWLHYLALLPVAVALRQPRLGPAWLLPLLYWAAPKDASAGSLAQLGFVLAVAVATVVAAWWPALRTATAPSASAVAR
jgi:alpha-1,2-mannosyltransferase